MRRVIKIESGGNPKVISKGNFGLMQIRHGTARSMGYAGDTNGLLDPDTNMTYAVKYLAGAYRAAGGNSDRAISLYQRGYYYEAKAKGFSPYERPAKPAPVLASVEPAETVTMPKPERVKRTAVALREPAPAMVPIPVAAPMRAAAPVVAAPVPVVAAPEPVAPAKPPAPAVVAAREPMVIAVAAPQPETKLEAAPVAAVAPVVARKGDRLVVAPLQAKPDQHAALQAEPAPVPIPTPRARTRRGHEEQPRSLFTDLKAEIVQAQGPATTQPATTRRSRRSDLMMAASPQAEPVQAQPVQATASAAHAREQAGAGKQAAGKPFDLSVFVKSFAAQGKKPPPSGRRAQPQTPAQPPS